MDPPKGDTTMLRCFAVAVGVLPFVLCGIAGDAWGIVTFSYSIEELGYCSADAINNSGQVVGRDYTTGHAFLWSRGSGMQDLGTPPGYTYSSCALGVNELGEVVGYAFSTTSSQGAFLWQESSGMQVLTPGQGSDINDDGQVVGLDRTTMHAFLWQEGSAIQDLGVLNDCTKSNATAINDDGWVVGGSSNDTNTFGHVFLWRSDTGMQDLGTLSDCVSWATDVNNHGQIVGDSYSNTHHHHAFLWQSDSQIQDLGTLGGGDSRADGINDRGKIVGFSTTDNGEQHAFMWTPNGGMQDLNFLVPPNSGWLLVGATAINNAGWIVGYGKNADGQDRAFLLTPVPEPSTLLLCTTAAVALLGILLRAKRVARNG